MKITKVTITNLFCFGFIINSFFINNHLLKSWLLLLLPLPKEPKPFPLEEERVFELPFLLDSSEL